MNYPLHTDCLALIARAMRLHGINEKDIDTMFKDNPRKFLSLPPRRPMMDRAIVRALGDEPSGTLER